MKLRPFKELIALSKEKLDEILIPVRVKQLKAQAQVEQAKIEEEILRKETKVTEMMADKEVNFSKLIDALDEISLLELRKEQYGEVISQMFPE